jgi:Uncharacterised nucleotidyltransferase
MKTTNLSAFLLSSAHRYLLQSIFATDNVAIAAWQQWLTRTDFENLDWESYQLLPILHQKLLQRQVQHPLMDRMKGIQRLFWCKNQVRLAEIQPLLTELVASKISIIWLENPPWGDQATHGQGLRLLNAYHLQASPEDYQPLIAVLQRLGWQCSAIDPIKSLDDTGKIWFEHGQHLSIVLHRHLSSWCALPEIMTVFGLRAVPIHIGNHLTHIWRLHDQVIYHMMQFGQSQDYSALPTIANLITLLRQSDLDWETLLSTAKHYRLLVPLQTLLITLRELKINLPEAAWAIEASSIHPIEQQEYAVILQNQSRLWARAVRQYARYHRCEMLSSQQPSLVAFLKFLCDRWSIQSIWQIPTCILSRQFRYWRQQTQH